MNQEAVLSQLRDTVSRAGHLVSTAKDLETRAQAAGAKAEAEVLLEAAELAASEAEKLQWAGAYSPTDLAGRPIKNPFQR